MAMKTVAFLRLTRPHFLVGGVLMMALGAVSAPVGDIRRYLLAQLMVTSAQVTAHYVNEYADFEADTLVAHRTFFSGGSGVLPAGSLDRRVALLAGRISSVIAIGAAIVVAGWSVPAAMLGLVALTVSWAYSMPPIRLLGTGWGEVATSLVVAGLVPCIAALSLGGNLTAPLLWSIAILIPIHLMMMLVFELPDLTTDTVAGKRGLAVRIGHRRSVQLIAMLIATGAVVAALGRMSDGLPARAAIGVAAAAVPALAVIYSAPRERPQFLTSAAVATFAAAGIGLVTGL